VKQIEIPETASRKMHLILQCLPIYVQRPRQQLRAIATRCRAARSGHWSNWNSQWGGSSTASITSTRSCAEHRC
jgi:hypothetical protein